MPRRRRGGLLGERRGVVSARPAAGPAACWVHELVPHSRGQDACRMFRRLAAIAFVCGLGGVLIAYTLGSPSWSASAAIPSRPDGTGQAQGGAMTRPFGLTIQQVRTCSVIAPASSAPAPPEPGVWCEQAAAGRSSQALPVLCGWHLCSLPSGPHHRVAWLCAACAVHPHWDRHPTARAGRHRPRLGASWAAGGG